MRFFSLEGSIPAALRDDGAAFILKSDGTWGEISAKELLSDTRTDELTAAEFDTRMAVFGGNLSTLPTTTAPLKPSSQSSKDQATTHWKESSYDYEAAESKNSRKLLDWAKQNPAFKANKDDRPAPSEFQHEKLAAAVASLSETQLKRAIAWGEELALRDALSMMIQKVRQVRGVKNPEAATAPLEPSSQSPKDQATIRSPELQFDYETPLLEASKRGLERLRKKLNKP